MDADRDVVAASVVASWLAIDRDWLDGLTVRQKAAWRRGLAAKLRAAGIPDAQTLEDVADGQGHGEVLGGAGDGGLVEVRAGRDDPAAEVPGRAA